MSSKIRKIFYLTLANVVFILHLALVLIVAFGWLIPSMYYVFLVLLAAVFLMDLFLGYCPLTPLEFGIRKKLDPTKTYDSSCIAHYMRALFGQKPRVETKENPTFLKKHSFKFILLGLFMVSTLFRLFVVGNQLI